MYAFTSTYIPLWCCSILTTLNIYYYLLYARARACHNIHLNVHWIWSEWAPFTVEMSIYLSRWMKKLRLCYSNSIFRQSSRNGNNHRNGRHTHTHRGSRRNNKFISKIMTTMWIEKNASPHSFHSIYQTELNSIGKWIAPV